MHTILGAGGVVGRETAKALHKAGQTVRLVSRHPVKVNENDMLHSADLTNGEAVMAALEGSETAYLTVGLPYRTKIWREQWPVIMRNVIEACARHQTRLIFLDNVYMIDPAHLSRMTEASPYGPVSGKGAVRREVAEMLLDAMKTGKVRGAIARAADFYGPDNDKSVMVELVFKNLHKNKPAMWLGNPDKKHNYTYTPDIGRVMALLGTDAKGLGRVWHIPSSEAYTGREWVEKIAAALQVKPRIKSISRGAARVFGLFNTDVRESVEMIYQFENDYFLDGSDLEKHFNFNATAAEEAIKSIITADFGKTG